MQFEQLQKMNQVEKKLEVHKQVIDKTTNILVYRTNDVGNNLMIIPNWGMTILDY
jgi:hypothetical protein